MLKEVEDLNDSISFDQLKDLKEALGADLFSLLEDLLDSSTEEEAESNVQAFVKEAKCNIGKVLKAGKILNKNQKESIFKFLGE